MSRPPASLHDVTTSLQESPHRRSPGQAPPRELPLAQASLRLLLGLRPDEQGFSELDIKSAIGRRRASLKYRRIVGSHSEEAAARRDAVRAILDRSQGILFDAQSVECWLGPIVYIALKDQQAVYVGSSRQGLRRVFGRHHKPHAFLGADLMVWSVPSVQDMNKLEQLLIAGLQPTLNVRQRGHAQRLSDLLGVSMSRARELARS